jgi:hypothetical protein
MKKLHKDQIAVLSILGKPSAHKKLNTNVIIDKVGFKSVNHAYYHLTKMVNKGLLDKKVIGKNAFYERHAVK